MGALDRFIDWLRAGYPAGVPEQDYVPLFALLRRRLSDEEIADLGRELVEKGIIPADRVDVGVGILSRTDEVPTPDEMHRVGEHLRAAGWDIEGLDESGERPAEGEPRAPGDHDRDREI